MSAQWYYAHAEEKFGPFSQQRLKEMAADGTLLPTDTVWREGVDQGAAASRIKNLFPWLDAPALAPAVEDIVANTALVPLEKAETPKAREKETPKPKRGRATAVKGAEIASQDGSYARYRKICTVCGEKDKACRTIPIANRLVKDYFFCPKCRKRRDVAIQCQQ